MRKIGEKTVTRSVPARRQTDQQTQVVGLIFGLVGGAISPQFAADGAFVNDDKALARVGLHAKGHHFAAALRRAVTRIYVQMKRPQAEGTVISGAVPEGLHLASAVGADELCGGGF